MGKECFANYENANSDYFYDYGYGEDYYGNYYCLDKCIGTDKEVPCACNKMVYKGGRAVPGQDLAANGIFCYDCPDCPDFPDCSNPYLPKEVWDDACDQPAAGANPLLKSSALVWTDLRSFTFTYTFKYHTTSLISLFEVGTSTFSGFFTLGSTTETEIETCNPIQCRSR